MATDTLGDMLTRIRNAVMVNKPTVAVSASSLNARVAQILKDEGYINDFTFVEEGARRSLNITLRYDSERRNRKAAIGSVRRISTPGRRVYCGANEIPRVLSGIGIAILSTPKGVITGKQARRLGVGGEVLCYVH